MTSPLPAIGSLITVTVNLQPPAAQMQNISTLLILGNSSVIDTVQRMRSYTTLAAVATDFGTTAPEYLAALLYFEQVPQPTSLLIGRWAQTATHGQLTGGTLSPTNQLLATWTAITTGSFHLNVDGGTAHDITGMNFSGATSLSGVAAVMQTAVSATYAGVTVTYDAVNRRFLFISGSTGSTSAVTVLSTASTGVDVSAQAGGTVATGAYTVAGLAPESAVSAATLFDTNFGQQWYALMMPTITADSDHVAVGGYVNGAANKHLYGVTSQEPAMLNSGDTTNVAYQLQQLGYLRTIVQYSSQNAYAVASLFGRILTVNYLQSASTITLMYKQEPGIVPETLTQTQLTNVTGYNANIFEAYNNSTAIIQNGVTSNGQFIDTVTGTDWLALAIQTALYNLLYLIATKVPQTDAGTHLLVTTIENVLGQAVVNGLLGPGTWTTGGFGQLNLNDFLPKGYYVYAPPLSTQSPSARSARQSVPIQIAAKLAGAVQTVNVAILVNS